MESDSKMVGYEIDGSTIRTTAICPNCGREASGIDAILSYFGLRKMDKTRIQSWCRECRNHGKKGDRK